MAGAVIVTTPQDIALLDAIKGIEMFRKVDVPILGVIENMATHVCKVCGHEEHIFGGDCELGLSSDYNISVLARLPLDICIREQSDVGHPNVIAMPSSHITRCFEEAATAIVHALKSHDVESDFPEITISED